MEAHNNGGMTRDGELQPRVLADRPSSGSAPSSRRWIVVVFAAAIVMGAPALRGGFLSGDDIQLVRDHVLVNHPSLAHAAKLFTIIHRDLYQPVPMLSMSIDFAIVQAFGFTPDASGAPPAAWWFHLTNVLLHAINAVLVYVLIRRLTGREAVAVLAGVIFALHPMGVETVAWLNGRMMLLSTLFALAAVIGADKCHRDRLWPWGPLTLLFVALCMMSKVRISLPALMLVPLLFRRQWPARRWWIIWGIAVAMTGVFGWINLQASSPTLERGLEHLEGSRLARTALALCWYWKHAVWPSGLAPYHPAAQNVTWSSPGVATATAVALAVLGVVALSARRTRTGWVGMFWFLAAVAVTLPLMPLRNLLVAERYAYLPNIGLYWIAAAAAVWAYIRLREAAGGGVANLAMSSAGGLAVAGMLGVSWYATGFYHDNVSKTGRVADLYSNYPGFVVRHGWSLYHAGDYEGALAAARTDLSRHGDEVASEAYQLIGMSLLRLGRPGEAIESLNAATKAPDDEGLAYYQLGRAYGELGRLPEAIDALEQCAQLLPNYNPGLTWLGRYYERTGRSQEAAAVYRQMLKNNPYDVFATLGLAQIEIASGRCEPALKRLRDLLEWMPENVPARINAGVCLVQLGRTEEAVEAYEAALHTDPDAKVATVNLALLMIGNGDRAAAQTVLADYLARHPADREALGMASANLVEMGELRSAAELWARAASAEPRAADLLAGYSRVTMLAGRWGPGAKYAADAARLDSDLPEVRVLACVVALLERRHDDAVNVEERLAADGVLGQPAYADDLARLLRRFAADHTDDPWPWYVMAKALAAGGREDAARQAADEARSRTSDAALLDKIDKSVGSGNR